MPECQVEETKLRSILKGVTAKTSEILLDTLIVYVFTKNTAESLGLAIGLEFICYLCNLANERLWNRTDFGRKVRFEKHLHIEDVRDAFVKEFLYADRFYEKNELQAKIAKILDELEEKEKTSETCKNRKVYK